MNKLYWDCKALDKIRNVKNYILSTILTEKPRIHLDNCSNIKISLNINDINFDTRQIFFLCT